MSKYLFQTGGQYVVFVPRMFMDTPEDEKTKLLSCLAAFRQFWGGLPPVSTAGDF